MKILLVDDDKEAMEWVPTILSKKEHEVEQITTIEEAHAKFTEAAKTRKWPYDLLILDVQILEDTAAKGRMSMDEMLRAGVTLHDEFRVHFPKEKVMILTNVMYRVSEDLHDTRYTITRDKLDMVRDLDAFVDEVQRFAGKS